MNKSSFDVSKDYFSTRLRAYVDNFQPVVYIPVLSRFSQVDSLIDLSDIGGCFYFESEFGCDTNIIIEFAR